MCFFQYNPKRATVKEKSPEKCKKYPVCSKKHHSAHARVYPSKSVGQVQQDSDESADDNDADLYFEGTDDEIDKITGRLEIICWILASSIEQNQMVGNQINGITTSYG